MIHALISGVLTADPIAATSRAGRDYCRGVVRVGDGDGAVFVSLFAFGEADAEELLAARKGDGVSASGRFQIGEFERDGVTRPSFAVFGARILTAAPPKKPKCTPKPKLTADAPDPFAGTAAADLDDVPALKDRTR